MTRRGEVPGSSLDDGERLEHAMHSQQNPGLVMKLQVAGSSPVRLIEQDENTMKWTRMVKKQTSRRNYIAEIACGKSSDRKL